VEQTQPVTSSIYRSSLQVLFIVLIQVPLLITGMFDCQCQWPAISDLESFFSLSQAGTSFVGSLFLCLASASLRTQCETR
jgi:hypothetical protein